eukprot:563091-Alexandrium_andersonii.AAC.1
MGRAPESSGEPWRPPQSCGEHPKRVGRASGKLSRGHHFVIRLGDHRITVCRFSRSNRCCESLAIRGRDVNEDKSGRHMPRWMGGRRGS